MKASPSRIYTDFLRILRRSTDLLNEDLIHEEIFSVERLEQYAIHLANELQTTKVPQRGRSLFPKLKESKRKLLQVYSLTAQTIKDKQVVSPAAEWFVDNYYIIEDQLREIEQDLPRNYYYELPKLETGELKGYPRVYAMAMAIIAHTDSRLDGENLRRFIQSFQKVAPLSIGELWAVPITLRIALLDRLTPLALRIVNGRKNRQKADVFADQLLALAALPQAQPQDLVNRLSQEFERAKSEGHFDRAFIVQLVQRLRDQDPNIAPALDWLENQLSLRSTSTQQVIQLEHLQQAAAQVTVGNIISSMRLLSALDWRDFFESVSLVDPILSRDPAQVYLKMDFATRDANRHAIERIAKASSGGELEIAKYVIELAENEKLSHWPNPRSHVGYYLIGEGVKEVEKHFSYRPRFLERLYRFLLAHPTPLYLGFLGFITACLLFPVMMYVLAQGEDFLACILISLLALVPASELALSLLNYYITFFIQPKHLPKMDTSKGIPNEAKTMVVIPTLFTSVRGVEELLQRLQIHYLANQDPCIYFALLGDFSDAPTETMPQDHLLLSTAEEGIKDLNARYAINSESRFYLFHRRRLWNPSEGKWIGWERKRGKLLEFNRLLRPEQGKSTSYVLVTAPEDLLRQIQYVITLDSDTQLPREAAHKLIGTILHPLNRPQLDPQLSLVTKGYGILQPRISVALTSAMRTHFAHLYSGSKGLDPYTTSVSDVYQDLFSEGSYTGKGLYVVDAFEAALANRAPENAILSHDLFEGSFARSALVTDIEFFDDYPSTYDIFAKRQHRWTRGDWQIAPWILPWVPTEQGKYVTNCLPWISRWKIFDNLRRSLVQPAMTLWLFLGWTVLPGTPLFWTLLVVMMALFPAVASLTNSLIFHRRGIQWRGHFANVWAETKIQIGQMTLLFVFLAPQAWNQLDAITRTLYRKLISKRKLLEWVTFAQSEQSEKAEKAEKLDPSNPSKRAMVISWKTKAGPLTGFLLAFGLAYFRLESFWVASPFLLAWISGPLIQEFLGTKRRLKRVPLGAQEIQSYRLYARRTWHFFETFVGEKDNWLAPDNFQEDPFPVLAHRTSPTNVGLQLLSTASAFDLGYLGLIQFVESLEKTLNTLQKMKRFHGHFFNWYDTITLEPLKPEYISTVDSGNLAGHLLTLKQVLAGIQLKPQPLKLSGFRDSLFILKEEVDLLKISSLSSGTITMSLMQESIDSISKYTESCQITSPEEKNTFMVILFEKLIEAEDILNTLAMEGASEKSVEARFWMKALLNQAHEFERDILREIQIDFSGTKLLWRLESLMDICDELVHKMDFRFLFDDRRKIFSIGYDVANSRKDNSYYDLLASESRLASFVAIAKGDVPQEHWHRLGRQMTAVQGNRALVAWTATMFEYLMPLLVMRRYEGTLLDQTYDSVVERQIQYGQEQGVPWGVSEAGYNTRDLQLNYQYAPFGIPGFGLKRGLSDDLVISPYSTMLAAMIDPWQALSNLQRLEHMGAFSRFGFFESIDYTSERLPKNKKHVILKSFMAHHQGMSLVAMNNLLNQNIMQVRFHSEPLVQATQLLLQEKVPQDVALTRPRAEEVSATKGFFLYSVNEKPRQYTDVHLSTPRTQLLSNGNYSVMITSAGSGFSICDGLAVNRWREDVTKDHWGQYFYIRERSSGKIWSATYLPIGMKPQSYEVTFTEDKAEFWREDKEQGIKTTTHSEIIISPEDNVELRRISLSHNSSRACEYEVTSFMEVVLAKSADDIAHPSFSNLFVQTEFASEEGALIATRRKRSENQTSIWGFHVLVTEGEAIGPLQYETDRSRFVGRGHDLSAPFAMSEDRPLSQTVGAVLDPIFSLRQVVRIPPGETLRIIFATGMASTREEALRLADKYHDYHIFSREADLAWTRARVQLRHLNVSLDMADTFQRLAARLIYSDPSLRPRSRVLALNTKPISNLWAYGISGDHPLLLVRISDEKDIEMVRELLRAHEYLRLKRVQFDLVILNEHTTSYIQSLQDELQRQIRMSGAQSLIDKPGGIFIRRSDLMTAEDLLLIKSVARVSLSAEKGTLTEQIERRAIESERPERLMPSVDAGASNRSFNKISASSPFQDRHQDRQELLFFNGLGGFTKKQHEYIIFLKKKDQWTPAPWINVIANSHDFGFLISESGAGYTWSVNSRENRLTPWSNDPVSDPAGEAIYLRDEDSGEFWTPTPLPIRDDQPYKITHGHGYTEFRHASHGIDQELTVFVAMDSPVKISRLKVKNRGEESRNISVTHYVEWVLGFYRGNTAPYVITENDPIGGLVFARNPTNNEFAGRVVFAATNEKESSFTCDRKEFIGRNGSLAKPEAMRNKDLSGRSGAGYDPCAAFRSQIQLEPQEEREIVFLLGDGASYTEAKELAVKYRQPILIEETLEKVKNHWDKVLGTIQIKTPDLSMDIMMNRWLLYQTLSCRLWARSAFYQSGGAYGFRDQLQDVMALVYSQPQIAREQILRASARQFKEGDVQHWWHPPTGRGVRTRFSDDLIWLPYVLSFYVATTGDRSILEERVAFIEAPPLESGQDDAYTQPSTSIHSATIYEHSARTLDLSLKVGRHGLPLMGSGDWNDGMNRVGNQGQGESVWVAWFLNKTLEQFIPLAESAKEFERAFIYQEHRNKLSIALEENAWDGDWYLRAFFDDGTPLGSQKNEECRIDSIAQSWSVLSGAGNLERSAQAMKAVEKYLIRKEDSLIQLFDPPFDKGIIDPGYIKGYVPGVRENGGQYTHAAIWTLMAFAALGEADKAVELFALINPINHAANLVGLNKYKVEPYVIAADVYGQSPHTGRGGWTWYTGSASWMYRAGLESLLGFELRGQKLRLHPCLPKSWKGFELRYQHGKTIYEIEVIQQLPQLNEEKVASHILKLDGKTLPSVEVPLVDDEGTHQIKLIMNTNCC
ncbi:MAG: hypothetical protein J0M15_13660 [Deltaproteobacteria bacterium]|nr:hypothetical protein [Deltaproteobacteria bacterium]